MDKDEKQYYVPKKLLGELVRILITSTDPANILGYTSATISATRALMIRMLENQIANPELINATLQALLFRLAESWRTVNKITETEAQDIERILMDVFKSESIMKYDLQLYRDILYCEDLGRLWHTANEQYIRDKSSWFQSNAILADINKILFEIIIRHNLMVLPYGDGFNLDQHGTDTGQVAQLLATLAATGGQ